MLCALLFLLLSTPLLSALPSVVVQPGSVTRVDISATETLVVKPGDTLVRGGKLIEMPAVQRDGLSIYVDGERLRASTGPVNTSNWTIQDEDDLAAYAAAIAANDDRVIGVGLEVDDGRDLVVLASRRRARLFGLFPLEYRLVTIVDALGGVQTLAPWWLAFATDDVAEATNIFYRPVVMDDATPLSFFERRLTNQVARLNALVAAQLS
ncbi:hypothetical protein D6789_02075 [Candidatus Woesearchaeota archaeon]|nr:MAG: hypothetical protein D6789_02075 [Candidatus Woesearchaeota archaeon]